MGKVGADVLLHGCPQSCMPNPVEGLLEVCEDVAEVLLICSVVLLPALKPACFSAVIFSLVASICSVDLQHDFAWLTDEADCFVVLALLQVAFLGKCDD